MSENREYVSRSDELGNIHISGEVLASIAAAAALEVEGVSGLSANLGSDIAELLSNKKNLTKGVHIQVEDEQVTVELAVLIWTPHPRGGTGRTGRGEEQRGVHDRPDGGRSQRGRGRDHPGEKGAADRLISAAAAENRTEAGGRAIGLPLFVPRQGGA